MSNVAHKLLSLLHRVQYLAAFVGTRNHQSTGLSFWKHHFSQRPSSSYCFGSNNLKCHNFIAKSSTIYISIGQTMANTRRSSRASNTIATMSSEISTDPEEDTKIKKNNKRKSCAKEAASSSEANDEKETKTKKAPKKTKKPPEETESSEAGDEKKTKKKRAVKVEHQRITEHDPPQLPKLWDEMKNPSSHTFTIISWNVAGLRAVLKNHPNALSNLVRMHNADVLCLQETKLQEKHLEDPKLNIRSTLKYEGYDAYWNCATSKLGYSGTAVFVKRYSSSSDNTNSEKIIDKGNDKKQTKIGQFFTKTETKSKRTKSGNSSGNEEVKDGKNTLSFDIDEHFVKKVTPTNIEYTIGNNEVHNSEGRTITVQYPHFTLVNVYVPNSGQSLERLDYRTKEWDKDFLSYMQEKQHQSNSEKNHPVVWLGDLNVAHKSKDVWNDGAKHLAKQAGTTEEERQSFTNQLSNGFIDAFRRLHPDAQGYYSYWSQRANNRPPNKGLRLDYFVCSEDLFDDEQTVVVRDSFMINDFIGSDHCPVVLQLEMKKE